MSYNILKPSYINLKIYVMSKKNEPLLYSEDSILKINQKQFLENNLHLQEEELMADIITLKKIKKELDKIKDEIDFDHPISKKFFTYTSTIFDLEQKFNSMYEKLTLWMINQHPINQMQMHKYKWEIIIKFNITNQNDITQSLKSFTQNNDWFYHCDESYYGNSISTAFSTERNNEYFILSYNPIHLKAGIPNQYFCFEQIDYVQNRINVIIRLLSTF